MRTTDQLERQQRTLLTRGRAAWHVWTGDLGSVYVRIYLGSGHYETVYAGSIDAAQSFALAWNDDALRTARAR